MRILHVIPAFQPAIRYGGPVFSVSSLCRALIDQGAEVRVLTTDADGPGRLEGLGDGTWRTWNGIPVRYCRRDVPESVSLELLEALREETGRADVVHLTGVYNFPTFPVLWACRRERKPVVWSPRGALQRWRGSRRVGLKAGWDWAVRRVAPAWLVMHATDAGEAAESAGRAGGRVWRTVSNGVSLPETVRRPGRGERLELVFLGRLDPKKGIPLLLEAVAQLAGDRERLPVRLRIAGKGSREYEGELRAKARECGVEGQVEFVGEVAGEAKTRLLESSDLAVFPSYTENFGIVAGEALAHAVPVIVSPNMPWQGVVPQGCGRVVETEPGAIAAAIREMAREDLREMGRAGRRWMEAEFSWEERARRMLEVYETAIGEAGREA